MPSANPIKSFAEAIGLHMACPTCLLRLVDEAAGPMPHEARVHRALAEVGPGNGISLSEVGYGLRILLGKYRRIDEIRIPFLR